MNKYLKLYLLATCLYVLPGKSSSRTSRSRTRTCLRISRSCCPTCPATSPLPPLRSTSNLMLSTSGWETRGPSPPVCIFSYSFNSYSIFSYQPFSAINKWPIRGCRVFRNLFRLRPKKAFILLPQCTRTLMRTSTASSMATRTSSSSPRRTCPSCRTLCTRERGSTWTLMTGRWCR